jgi:hypothetical protein
MAAGASPNGCAGPVAEQPLVLRGAGPGLGQPRPRLEAAAAVSGRHQLEPLAARCRQLLADVLGRIVTGLMSWTLSRG